MARRTWYRLDNIGKFYSSQAGRSSQTVFRYSAELADGIDPDILQHALDHAIAQFPSFNVHLLNGMFWHYLEQSDGRPLVEPEHLPICSRLHYGPKSMLFRVSYFRNRVNLEVSHIISDGRGAINLFKSLDMIDKAYDFIKTTVAHNGTVLFVGTKKQAQEAIANQATRVNMPYVSERWLGGMLTNFQTVSKRVNRLKELEEMDFTDVHGSGLTKKELLLLEREKDKLNKQLGGIRNMNRTPSAMFVVDITKEALAVEEAHKLGIPVVAIVDTNADPDTVEYPIPANDDRHRFCRCDSRLHTGDERSVLRADSARCQPCQGRGRSRRAADGRLGEGTPDQRGSCRGFR